MENKTARARQTAHGGAGQYYETGHSHTNINRAAAQEPKPIYASNGRIIGQVSGDTFHKNVRGTVHMLRKPRGWAVDEDVLADLRKLGVAHITITDTETKATYTAPLAKFEHYCVPIRRGFGPQVVLPLGYWSVDGKPPRRGQPNQPDPDAPRQLPLFAEVGTS